MQQNYRISNACKATSRGGGGKNLRWCYKNEIGERLRIRERRSLVCGADRRGSFLARARRQTKYLKGKGAHGCRPYQNGRECRLLPACPPASRSGHARLAGGGGCGGRHCITRMRLTKNQGRECASGARCGAVWALGADLVECHSRSAKSSQYPLPVKCYCWLVGKRRGWRRAAARLTRAVGQPPPSQEKAFRGEVGLPPRRAVLARCCS